MARIVEYLYRGPTVMRDNSIRWIIKSERRHLDSSRVPLRFVLRMTNDDLPDDTVVDILVDTDDGYTLGVPGTTEHFRYDPVHAELTINLGGTSIEEIPVGDYHASLVWYDSLTPNGVSWGEDHKLIKVRDG